MFQFTEFLIFRFRFKAQSSRIYITKTAIDTPDSKPGITSFAKYISTVRKPSRLDVRSLQFNGLIVLLSQPAGRRSSLFLPLSLGRLDNQLVKTCKTYHILQRKGSDLTWQKVSYTVFVLHVSMLKNIFLHYHRMAATSVTLVLWCARRLHLSTT